MSNNTLIVKRKRATYYVCERKPAFQEYLERMRQRKLQMGPLDEEISFRRLYCAANKENIFDIRNDEPRIAKKIEAKVDSEDDDDDDESDSNDSDDEFESSSCESENDDADDGDDDETQESDSYTDSDVGAECSWITIVSPKVDVLGKPPASDENSNLISADVRKKVPMMVKKDLLLTPTNGERVRVERIRPVVLEQLAEDNGVKQTETGRSVRAEADEEERRCRPAAVMVNSSEDAVEEIIEGMTMNHAEKTCCEYISMRSKVSMEIVETFSTVYKIRSKNV